MLTMNSEADIVLVGFGGSTPAPVSIIIIYFLEIAKKS